MGKIIKVYRILVGKFEVNRAPEYSRHKRDDNIETEIKKVKYDCMDWVQLAQVEVQWRALVNTIINF